MNIPRRVRMDKWCLAEKAISDAMLAVENMPADVRLTRAVNLLAQAKDSVADYVDGVEPAEWQKKQMAMATATVDLVRACEINEVSTLQAWGYSKEGAVLFCLLHKILQTLEARTE